MTIEGRIDEELQMKIPVRVRGLRGIVDLEAVIDTGFNGALCLPVSVAVSLGLVLVDLRLTELADGRIQPELVFEGWIQLGEATEQIVDILITYGEDALLGMALLNLMGASISADLTRRTLQVTLPSS
ncbi:aspartyl protease family protein [Fervidibacter sacchari]